YVKVNNAIRSLRVQDIGSLHYGAIDREVRMNPLSSNLWLRRFDTPQEIRQAIDASREQDLLRMPSGLPCPWPGVWICEEQPDLTPHTFSHADRLPEVKGQSVT
ncbi:type VI immunity family protein, partial [Enterobacter hormaechei]|uniref:type VI immunity family protein n=1 Tax=Enterobacter hormaechei TaxID=158836 RepID=UPI003F6DCBF8|nr:hypothetical protein [Enterobacter hormaechei]